MQNKQLQSIWTKCWRWRVHRWLVVYGYPQGVSPPWSSRSRISIQQDSTVGCRDFFPLKHSSLIEASKAAKKFRGGSGATQVEILREYPESELSKTSGDPQPYIDTKFALSTIRRRLPTFLGSFSWLSPSCSKLCINRKRLLLSFMLGRSLPTVQARVSWSSYDGGGDDRQFVLPYRVDFFLLKLAKLPEGSP